MSNGWTNGLVDHYENSQEIAELPNEFALAFYEKCDGRLIMGGGLGNNGVLNRVVEYRDGKWEENHLPILNTSRKLAAACYIKNTLVVAGGRDNTDRLDSIEIMENITKNNTPTEWKPCLTNLPDRVEGHTLSTLKGKVYLIGGNNGGRNHALFSRVWKADINLKHGKFDLDFQKMDVPMQIPRWNHFSLCVQDKIYVWGGEKDGRETSQVEVFDGEEWTLGPKFDVRLDREIGDGKVLVDNNIILITSKNYGIIIYDPIKSRIKYLKDKRMKDKRNQYVIFSI